MADSSFILDSTPVPPEVGPSTLGSNAGRCPRRRPSPAKCDTRALASWEAAKAEFDDRVMTIRAVSLKSGETIPAGTHCFVIEAIESPATYEVEFDLETRQILATVTPDDVGMA
jgi:hypothetical protein